MNEPIPTKEKSKKIGAINKETIHRICSGQVVIDLSIAVKELVENSLDSGATIVDVKLTDHGTTCITVSDNGSGVEEQDFEGLGLKHHTSKLCEFSDLTEVSTFGFRGEALSSLCALSDLSIVTRHSTSEHGFKLEFDKNGLLKKKEICAREKGTSVHVRNIFKNLPVRAKEFHRNIKKEYARTVQILYSYCLISVNAKITCTNTISGKSSNLIVSTTNEDSILKNIIAVFGNKSIDNLVQIELQPPDEATLEEYNLPNNSKIDFDWECYVSNNSHTCGRSTSDRQFFYVNGRPCDLTKISKLINHIYHKFNNKQYPFVFLNLKLSQECADINVTPDKRTILFTQEKIILACIKFNLTKKWEFLQGNFTVKTLTEMNVGFKRIASTDNDPPAKRMQIFRRSQNTEKKYEKETHVKTNNILKEDNEVVEELLNVEIPIDIQKVKKIFYEKKNTSKNNVTKKRILKYKAQIETTQNSEAEKELKRELTKDSFTKMKVIGQFNFGFIIVLLENDLFIIDQHATDEKFRFEKLSNETRLKTQKLIIPKPLNFSYLNETILIEHQKIFESNGFEIKINAEEQIGKRVELIGMPVSFGWQFGQEDIEELIFLIKEGLENKVFFEIPRPSRVQQMLASRACRSAVMIGTALNNTEMMKLVIQMSQMKNPWNCPHGRPTIRHLFSMSLMNR
ncbi:mismatch repair endonuclease PMS2-like [Polistes fuscatus]|uniref:mismatch repair endonuclease PMS2-like n=1 Tax=Polistes fuscatus TaxID=30207 RepID=UPI001CA9190E|nr:mismatch repair endonuclease PMS2-like [Polistes fuscatus]